MVHHMKYKLIASYIVCLQRIIAFQRIWRRCRCCKRLNYVENVMIGLKRRELGIKGPFFCKGIIMKSLMDNYRIGYDYKNWQNLSSERLCQHCQHCTLENYHYNVRTSRNYRYVNQVRSQYRQFPGRHKLLRYKFYRGQPS